MLLPRLRGALSAERVHRRAARRSTQRVVPLSSRASRRNHFSNIPTRPFPVYTSHTLATRQLLIKCLSCFPAFYRLLRLHSERLSISHSCASSIFDVTHRFALRIALQSFCSRVKHPFFGVQAHRMPISVFGNAQILRFMTAIRRNLFYAQSHCAFAAACPYALTACTSIVLDTTLNSADENKYYFFPKRTQCD